MRNFIAGVVLFLISVIVSAGEPGGAFRPDNVLQKSQGLWSTDENGKWMFCAYYLDETGLELEAAKCWAVPYEVTGTRQARI